MNWVEMNVAQSTRSGGKVFSFEAWQGLEAAGKTPAILIPDIQQGVTVTVTPVLGATVAVYSSTSPVEYIKTTVAGILWVEWAAGIVAVQSTSVFYPVSAIMMEQFGAGGSVITLRAQ
jgi:hypothetical protein